MPLVETEPAENINIKKPNFYYTRVITPKRVTSDGAHLRVLAPEQHSSEEMCSDGEPEATLCPV